MVVCHVFHLDRPESAKSHVERYMCNPDTLLHYFSRSSCVKCSPAVGAASEPSCFCIDCLVSVLSCSLCDIRRQRHFPESTSRISSKIPSYVNWIRRFPSSTISRTSPLKAPSPKISFVPGFAFFPGFTRVSHISFSLRFKKQDFDMSVRSFFSAEQTGRNHFRIIDHKTVARPQI